MTLGSIAGRKLFVPAQHLWLRLTKLPISPATSRYPWRVELGVSARGLEDIGDVSEIKAKRSSPHNNSSNDDDNKAKNEWFAKAGDDVVTIEHNFFTTTAADELYHTVWACESGQTIVKAPVSGIVEEVYRFSDEEELDDDNVLVTMTTSCDALRKIMGDWLEKEAYGEFVTGSNGKFGPT